MKDIVIEGVPERVFPLRETEQCIVYVPIRKMMPVDYRRFLDMENNNTREEDLLHIMRDKVLDNGQNALVLYAQLIEVLYKQPPRTLYKNRNAPDSAETIKREVEEAGKEASEQEETEPSEVVPKSRSKKSTGSTTNKS